MLKKLFIIKFLLSSLVFASSESPQGFGFQGRLFNVDGTNPLEEPITLRFQIYDPSGSCLLYQESQTTDLTGKSGFFALYIGSTVGAPKREGTDPGLSMANVFKNDSSIQTRANHASCPGGYTPTIGDVRLLRVTVTPDSTGIAETLSPDQVIGSVPQALVAETLQGLSPNDFIQKDSVYITQANIDKLFSSFVGGVVDASTLHHHDGRYLQTSSASSQDFGSGGFSTTGTSSVGSSSNFANTMLSVKTSSNSQVGLAIRANTGAQTANLFEIQNNAGTSLMSVANNGVISSTGSNISSSSGNQLSVAYDSSNKLILDVNSTGQSTFTMAGTSPQFSFIGGNLGIGTSNPGAALNVESSSNPPALLTRTNTASNSTMIAAAIKSKSTSIIADGYGTGLSFRIEGNGLAETNLGSIAYVRDGANNSSKINFSNVSSGTSQTPLVITSAANVGIGTTTPSYTLDVAGNGGNITAMFGADNSATTRTNATQKTTRLAVPHYTNAEEPMALFYASSSMSTNLIAIGGGTSLLNSATQIGLYTASNNTTATGTERVRIDSNGNVGIGTTTPNTILDVRGAQYSVAVPFNQLSYDTAALAANTGSGIGLGGYNGISWSTYAGVKSGKDNAVSGENGGYLGLYTRADGGNVTEKVRITSAGNVGIGTTTPNTILDVRGAQYSVAIPFNQLSYDTAALAANTGSGLGLGGYNGVGWSTYAGVKSGKDNAVSGENGGYLGLHTRADGGNVTEKVRITSAGNVGIGTTAPANRLHVVGVGGSTVAYISDGSASCSITPSVAGSVACSSDQRLKKNVKPFPDSTSLENILKLNTVIYEWKHVRNGQHTGYIAQEVEKVAQEFVTTGKDGYKQVSYGGFIPWITGAIKKLHQMITHQDKQLTSLARQIASKDQEIKDLKKENAEIKKRLEKIEKSLVK